MRTLNEVEISQLEKQGCQAEDWTAISVDEDFVADYITNVSFFGDVTLGVFDKNIEVEEGFSRHAGLHGAVLNNVVVGDNCLIEGVGGYISNYEIGEECYISNVGKISSTGYATFGEGNVISVQNEGGAGNVIIFDGLTSHLAAFMMHYASDNILAEQLFAMIRRNLEERKPERGSIGYRVKIVNTREITNTIINDECEISGASRVNDCSILSNGEASTFIGSDVIIDNVVVQAGSSVTDGAKADNCLVGEASHLGKGASAENTLFFANSYLDNGEACAAFCGPFTVSHHKSTLLIGGEYSFYNAGSNTNFSNHAYKMGPIHWGTMQRGAKTASGCHILWPATIGAFSMCMGKIQSHPDVADLPFSYIFGEGTTTYLVPGINITTIGTWRDINKWPKRDMRPYANRQSLVVFDWLSPFVAAQCMKGMNTLERLRQEQGVDTEYYNYGNCRIKNRSLQKGIEFYDLAIRLFIGRQLEDHPCYDYSTTGCGEWLDLGGLLIPEMKAQEIASDVKDSSIDDLTLLNSTFQKAYDNYDAYKWQWTCHEYEITDDNAELRTKLTNDYHEALGVWLQLLETDAAKEFAMGDVSMDTYNEFIEKLKIINEKK